MKVNLVGAVGGGNFGDEFILSCCIREHSQKKDCAFFISGFGDNLYLKDNANILKNGVNFFDLLLELRELKINDKEITIDDILIRIENKEESDEIHFIGGGYINSLWPSNYALLALAYIYSTLKGKEIYATGLGLYPYVENDHELIELFNSLSLIDVRDSQSESFVLNSINTGDDALLAYKDINSLIVNIDQPSLILSLQSHLFNGENLINNIFSEESLKVIINKKIKNIIIIEAAPEDNVEIPRELYNKALEKGIKINFYSGEDLVKKGIPYHKESFVISTRYHINLLYSMLSLDGIAVYENDYYKNKHLSINEMGGRWKVVSHEQLIDFLKNDLYSTSNRDQDNNGMKTLASAKEKLFTKIISQNLDFPKKSASLDLALSIVNKYIGK